MTMKYRAEAGYMEHGDAPMYITLFEKNEDSDTFSVLAQLEGDDLSVMVWHLEEVLGYNLNYCEVKNQRGEFEAPLFLTIAEALDATLPGWHPVPVL